MEFWHALNKDLEVTRPEVAISLEKRTVRLGERIHGTVRLIAGPKPRTVRVVRLSLEEYWPETVSSQYGRSTYTAYHTLVSTDLATDVDLAPRERKEYNFEIVVPSDIRVTTSALSVEPPNEGCILKVHADVSFRLSVSYREMLEVLPPAQMNAVESALTTKLGFIKSSLANDSGLVLMRFEPPEHLRGELDEIRCAFQLKSDSLGCCIVFDLQEKRFVDYFKALMGKDDIEYAVDIPLGDLVDDKGTPQHDKILGHLRPLFERAGIRLPHGETS